MGEEIKGDLEDHIAKRIVDTHLKSPIQLQVAIRDALIQSRQKGRFETQEEIRRALGIVTVGGRR